MKTTDNIQNKIDELDAQIARTADPIATDNLYRERDRLIAKLPPMKTTDNTLWDGETPIANPEDYIKTGDFNPHNIKPWIMGNEYGALAVAYASCEQDAFDAACDAGLLNGLALDAETVADREKFDGEGIMYLGNASEPFDSEYAWIKRLPNKSPNAE